MSLPSFTTPQDVAQHFGANDRWVADKVRELGCFAKLGQRVVMFEHHVKTFLEAIECPSNSISAASSGTTRELLPAGDTEALLARLKNRTPKGSRRKSNTKLGSVVSMGQGRT